MTGLRITLGQHTRRGRKPVNQDFHGAVIPEAAMLAAKGIAVALADGISSSRLSHIASETAVKNFLEDYYCTSVSWSVTGSATRVIRAMNAWLHVQTRQAHDDPDHGHVCTFDALVLHSATAHVFHVGDARVYRLAGGDVEQLTRDHRVVVSSVESYLGRALGAGPDVEIDYQAHPLCPGDHFVLATDGVCAGIEPPGLARAIAEHPDDLDAAARAIVAAAAAGGGGDDLTVQVVRIDAVPLGSAAELGLLASDLPLPPPLLAPRTVLDGYRVVRQLHASDRSHVYLATDEDGVAVALKIPATDLRADAPALRRFMMEEWIARRIDNPHVLRAAAPRRRTALYVATEYVEGQSLGQWMVDHPRPDLHSVRVILDQVARGLQAFHRRGMLHQDLRPENILIDKTGTVRIIDFGSVRVNGLAESILLQDRILGTVQYAAPEYFVGEAGTQRSDIFSLGVIAYQMLTGALPYGATVPRATRRSEQRRLLYRSAMLADRDVPSWVDGAIAKAVSVDPRQRYAEVSEFLSDLKQPNPDFIQGSRSVYQRNPLRFWQGVALGLAVLSGVLAYRLLAAS